MPNADFSALEQSSHSLKLDQGVNYPENGEYSHQMMTQVLVIEIESTFRSLFLHSSPVTRSAPLAASYPDHLALRIYSGIASQVI